MNSRVRVVGMTKNRAIALGIMVATAATLTYYAGRWAALGVHPLRGALASLFCVALCAYGIFLIVRWRAWRPR